MLTGAPSDESQNAHNEVYQQNGGYDNPDNQAKFSHELVAGAASFEGFKLYEDHQRKEGKQPSATYSISTKLSGQQARLSITLSPRSCSWVSLVVKSTSSLRLRVCYVASTECPNQRADSAPGMNAYDRERAHHQAKQNSRDLYDQHYIQDQGADRYDTNQYSAPDRFQGGGGYGGNNY